MQPSSLTPMFHVFENGRLNCFGSKARQRNFSRHFMTWQNMLLKNLFLLSSFMPGSNREEKGWSSFGRLHQAFRRQKVKMGKVGKSSKKMILCIIPCNCMTFSGFSVHQWLQAAGPLDAAYRYTHNSFRCCIYPDSSQGLPCKSLLLFMVSLTHLFHNQYFM